MTQLTPPIRPKTAFALLGILLIICGFYIFVARPVHFPNFGGEPQQPYWDTVNTIHADYSYEGVINVTLRKGEYQDINAMGLLEARYNETSLENWIDWAMKGGAKRNWFVESSYQHASLYAECNSTERFSIVNANGKEAFFRIRAYYSQDTLGVISLVNDGRSTIALKVTFKAASTAHHTFMELRTPQ